MKHVIRWIRGRGDWLERRGLKPAYAGGVLLGLALFLFAAATNTLAGWLYVMSGIMLALLALAARLPRRNLSGITVDRLPIDPVSAGEGLVVELRVKNTQSRPKGLFQVIEVIPPTLGSAPSTALRTLAPGQAEIWRYRVPTVRRGIYPWSVVRLRSAAPLGLFWYRRDLAAPAVAVIYPHILPLQHCPIVDSLGDRAGQQWHYHPVVKPATEGVTRSLRPYRWGDPTRLIHWRTSARYGELRVRELEKVTASQEVVIALNTQAPWPEDSFEQAVMAAASLYHYAMQKGFAAALWLSQGTLLQDRPGVMEALAAIQSHATASAMPLPEVPTLWLTPATTAPARLAPGSRQVVWGQSGAPSPSEEGLETLWIDAETSLQAQLQGQAQGQLQSAP